MNGKTKIVVNRKQPKGVVNLFGNIQSKVGTYERDKIELFKKKMDEKCLELGDKLLFLFDSSDDLLLSFADDFIDKLVDSYEKHKQEKKVSVDIVESHVSEIEEKNSIIPKRRINFEDLEPLGYIIDEEDDIKELQELKMELLFNGQDSKVYEESGGIRKK